MINFGKKNLKIKAPENRNMKARSRFEIDVVADHKCLLGEGPLWDNENKTICWIDILNGEIHEYSIKQKVKKLFLFIK